MMELSQPGPRRVYCVQDTYPKWSNTTQFSLDGEQLAYPIRPNLGEADLLGVFAKPIPPVVEALQKNSSRSELWQNLPSAIED